MLKPKRWLLLTAILSAMVGSIGSAQAAFTAVGNPATPGTLQQEIINAYNAGATGVTITPGKYVLPQPAASNQANFAFSWFSRAFEIDGYNVELVLQGNHDGVQLWDCSNVTIKGLTLDRGVPYGGQGQITGFGVDPNNAGVYYDVQVDAGYPALTGWDYNIILAGNSHVPKPGTWDLGWKTAVDNLGNNKVRIHSSNPKNWNGWSIQVGDYIACHAGGNPLLEVYSSSNCTFQDVQFLQSPCWCTIREDQCTGNHYYYDKITYGPTPAGATNPPLLSTGSGFQGVDDYVGPDVQNCLFEGMADDGFDLRGQLINVTAVSGSTVTVADPTHWLSQDPIRLSDDHGGYQDANVTGISGSVLTLNQPVTIQVGAGIQTRASNPNRNCKNYKIINTTVRDNRARGILARGDGGLIQGCTLVNNSMASILIGLEPGYGWAEGDYSHNVLIQNNSITSSAYGYSQAAGIMIGGCGSQGNQNITIRNNVFTGIWGQNISADGVSGLNLNWNTFANTYQSNLKGSGSVIALSNAANVTLNNNGVTASGPYQTGLVSVGAGVTNLVNNNASGIATGILSSGLYKLTHRGTAKCLDVYANGTSDGTNVQQYMDNGNDAQRWVATDLLNGYFKLGHRTTNKVLSVLNASLANSDGGQTIGNVVQWTDNGNPEQQWAIADQGNGSVKLTNRNSGKCLDVNSNSAADGANVAQYVDNGNDAQRWVLNLISPLPSANLVQNGSFENNGFTYNPSSWSTFATVGSNAAYTQNWGVALPDGDYQLVNYSANPYTVDSSQLITGLTNGAYYTATAWVRSWGGVQAAYFYANGYDASSQVYANIPATGNWTKVTLSNILVANGQCRIGLHTQDTTGNHTIVMDNVAFFKQ